MYLTRVPLNVEKRRTMEALASPNMFHGALEAAFPNHIREDAENGGRYLWRIDSLHGTQYLMILSKELPDLGSFVAQFGFPGETAWESRDYTPLLDRVHNGSTWHFRLIANPTKAIMELGNKDRGQACAHITSEYQVKWLLDRAEKNGFAIEEAVPGEKEVQVTRSQWHIFLKRKERKKVSLLAVTYEGILTVTDEEKFKHLLTNGIGRGKAYGNGLMTLVQVRGRSNE